MPALTYTTALVAIPPAEIWPPIQAIRYEHDQKVRRGMPHTTLVDPFRRREDFAGFREPLTAALARMPPFDVTLAEFRTFGHVRQTGAMRNGEYYHGDTFTDCIVAFRFEAVKKSPACS